MKSQICKSRVELYGECVLWVLVLVFGYLLIDPRLLAHSWGLPFQTTGRFFHEATEEPGVMITYFSAYLMQIFEHRFFGTLLMVLLIGLVRIFFGLFLRRIGSPIPCWFCHVPGLLLLVLLLHYQFLWIYYVLALVFVLGLSVIHLYVPLKQGWQRVIFFTVMALPYYHLLAGSFLLYAILVAIWELFDRKERIIGIILIIASFCVPNIAAQTLYVINLNDAYFFLTPWKNRMFIPIAAQALYISLPAVIIAAFSIRWIAPNNSASAMAYPAWKTRIWPLINGFKHPGPFLAASLLLFIGNYDGNAKKLMLIDYWAQQEDWQRVLAVGQNIQKVEPDTISDINRALCHSKALLESMFDYPQRLGWPLWLSFHEKINPKKCVKASDLLLELGQVNRAERMAVESLELNGYQAGALRNLFWVNVLKGEPTIARHFLLMLEKVPNHTAWARQYLGLLAKDPGFAGGQPIQTIKDFMILEDYVGEYPAEDVLKQLIRRSRRNRMAFDYLMAHYMLNMETEKILENWNRFAELGYQEIPRHIQEALLFYQKTKSKDSLPQSKQVAPNIQERFNRFNQVFMNNRDNAQKAMESEFGNTYWYYYLFERSGKFQP